MGQINDCKFSVMSGGGTPPELPIVFHAASYDPDTFELQQEVTGVGGETCTHTSEKYAPDKDGVYHAFGANEPVWEGFRESAGQYYADDGTGTLLDPLPMLVYQGAATNNMGESNDFSAWTVTNSVPIALDSIGLDGSANGSYTLTDPDSGANWINSPFYGTGRAAGAIKCWVLKDATAQASIQVEARLGGVYKAAVQVSPVDGQYATPNPDVIEDITVDAVGPWFVLTGYINVDFDNIQIRPCGGAIPPTGIYSSSHTGATTVGQVEMHYGKTAAEVRDLGPIFTAGTEVSTDEIINTWAAANHADAGDSYEADYKLTGGDQVLLSMGGTAVLSVVSGDVVLSDGTNSCSTPVVSAEPHIKATYNATDGMTLDVDGVTATSAYDGTLGSGDLSTKATQRDLIRRES